MIRLLPLALVVILAGCAPTPPRDGAAEASRPVSGGYVGGQLGANRR